MKAFPTAQVGKNMEVFPTAQVGKNIVIGFVGNDLPFANFNKFLQAMREIRPGKENFVDGKDFCTAEVLERNLDALYAVRQITKFGSYRSNPVKSFILYRIVSNFAEFIDEYECLEELKAEYLLNPYRVFPSECVNCKIHSVVGGSEYLGYVDLENGVTVYLHGDGTGTARDGGEEYRRVSRGLGRSHGGEYDDFEVLGYA